MTGENEYEKEKNKTPLYGGHLYGTGIRRHRLFAHSYQ
jgi:hypothetical protein